jgi:hypothetical protein
MISFTRLRERKRFMRVGEWILDSGAFSEINRFGDHRSSVEAYVKAVNRWAKCGQLVAAVTQDYMCEPQILQRTGLDIRTHQARTIERYLCLRALAGCYVMPVLQGFNPESYAEHLCAYGSELIPGQWVGVGSVCKRNSSPTAIEDVLVMIATLRPDLRLHGFGIKLTALKSPTVRALLYSSDSMAWSYGGRRQNGADANDPRLAQSFARKVERLIARKESPAIQCLLPL